ncbi:hypothetical protein J6590_082071 [Homalodisca vitripennis]|nr:hypothetical protein J6590_081547 [Homalodisca vitripennis]KAG8285343.1 hypothetical protein J6590_082071 [Homalodisca vitripennis]
MGSEAERQSHLAGAAGTAGGGDRCGKTVGGVVAVRLPVQDTARFTPQLQALLCSVFSVQDGKQNERELLDIVSKI